MSNSRAIAFSGLVVLSLWIGFPFLSETADASNHNSKSGVGSFRDAWFSQETMTGSWGGLRDRLEQSGVTPFATYTTDLLGNASGGIRRKFQYAGGLEFGLSFNLEKLLGLKGLVFDITGDYRSGRDLSVDIGNNFTAAQIFGLDTFFDTGSVRLYRLSLEQSLFDERLSLLAGRIGMGDDFLTSDLYGTFVQTAFNSNPISVTTNLPSFSSGPVAIWGFRTNFEPVEEWYVMGGVYYADGTIGLDSKHGVDFSIRSRNTGVITIMQIGYRHNQGKDAIGLPGNYYIGSYYDSNRFEDLGNSDRVSHGNYGLYFHVDRLVYREGGSDSNQGLTPFLAATFAPLSNFNTFPYYFMMGLVYQGLIPERDDDTTSLGLAHGQFSNRLSETYEMVLELTHNLQVSPWFSLQPTFQYIFRPGGSGRISDAIVIGWQVSIDF